MISSINAGGANFSSQTAKGYFFEFLSCQNCAGMASVPQSYLFAKQKRKKGQKNEFHQKDMMQPSCYNNKMMDSIWGQYNKYSVHNLKSMQNDEVEGLNLPVQTMEAMEEHCNQIERYSSPVLQRVKEETKIDTRRSRSPLRRVLEDHLRVMDRARSPSLSAMSDEMRSRSNSPLMRMIEDHEETMALSQSPLLQVAKESYFKAVENSGSPTLIRGKESSTDELPTERSCSPLQFFFENCSPNSQYLHN